MASASDFPPVRACIFDMDGVVLDSADQLPRVTNEVLAKYGKPALPWSIRAQIMGRSRADVQKILHEWAGLPITDTEFTAERAARQVEAYKTVQPVRGVSQLLLNLDSTKYWETEGKPRDRSEKQHHRVHLALATGAYKDFFKFKSASLQNLFSLFSPHRRILGDDERLMPGRTKPYPDIFLLALQSINDSLPTGTARIKPEECLVLEDSVVGVEGARRAGMRVLWLPHPLVRERYKGREEQVLAGITGDTGELEEHQAGSPGELKDGWGECLESLETFSYGKYGIEVPFEAGR